MPTLHCELSGLPLARLSTLPSKLASNKRIWISSWKQSQLQHPIFSLPTPALLDRWELSKFFKEGPHALSTEEQQLLFLAIIERTGLLKIRKAGLPPIDVAKRFFWRAIKFLAFQEETNSTIFTNRCPSFVPDSLWTGFSAWLEACENSREAWGKAIAGRSKLEKKHKKAIHLETRIKKWEAGYSKKPVAELWDYACLEIPDSLLNKKVLSSEPHNPKRWMKFPEATVTAQNAPRMREGSYVPISGSREITFYAYRTYDRWYEIWTATAETVEQYDIKEFFELRDTVTDCLEVGTAISFEINQHLKMLGQLFQNVQRVFDISEVLSSGVSSEPINLSTECVAQQNAMLREPKRTEFASTVEFLKAKALWNLKLRSQA